MADDIELDEDIEVQAPAKPKSATPGWMVALVIVAFACFTATLVMQVLEYSHYRSAEPAGVLIPTS